jgi:predicted regulator of Ras-like GTPase activity (Roadblock/LC7/MglB family)
MALSKAERNQQIDRSLAELASLRGVTTAAIVDSDGFVTHIRRDFEIDADALGASVQIMFNAAHGAAAQLGQSDTKVILAENKDGLVLLAPLARDFVLTLVADGSAMLGTLRFELKESVVELNTVLNS